MNAPLSNLYAMRELQLVLNHLKIGCDDRILEIGCGNGLGSIIVSKISKEVVGIDVSAPVIKILRDNYERHNLKFVCMDATRECPKSMREYFSKVFCIDVMEHIEREKRDKLLTFASNSLMRGGRLVFTFPMNNLNHGHLITEKDVYEFATHLSKSFELVDVKFLKSNFVGQIIDNFYGNIQKILVPSKEGNLFEESTCFQMLQNPKWHHKLIKLGTFLLFKLSAHSYKATEPSGCSRALIIGMDKK
jgi:SAM-dependent methyltransferase